jgi:hypothetical protein
MREREEKVGEEKVSGTTSTLTTFGHLYDVYVVRLDLVPDTVTSSKSTAANPSPSPVRYAEHRSS